LAPGQSLDCDLQGYKTNDGLKAEIRGGALEFACRSESDQELRAQIHHPRRPAVLQEVAVQKGGRHRNVLGSTLQPEFYVTSGKRRMSIAQAPQFKRPQTAELATAEPTAVTPPPEEAAIDPPSAAITPVLRQ